MSALTTPTLDGGGLHDEMISASQELVRELIRDDKKTLGDSDAARRIAQYAAAGTQEVLSSTEEVNRQITELSFSLVYALREQFCRDSVPNQDELLRSIANAVVRAESVMPALATFEGRELITAVTGSPAPEPTYEPELTPTPAREDLSGVFESDEGNDPPTAGLSDAPAGDDEDDDEGRRRSIFGGQR